MPIWLFSSWAQATVITSYSIHYTKLYDPQGADDEEHHDKYGENERQNVPARLRGAVQVQKVVQVHQDLDHSRHEDTGHNNPVRQCGALHRITSYNVCYTKLLRGGFQIFYAFRQETYDLGKGSRARHGDLTPKNWSSF